MYHSMNSGSMDTFVTGAAITAGAALYMLIKNYLERGNLLGQQEVEDFAELEARRGELEKAKAKLEEMGFDKK